MPPIAILILSDERPGHYHLAEGVAAAIERRTPVTVARLATERRRSVPGRVLAGALGLGLSPGIVLRRGYRIGGTLPDRIDLVISAGGDTLAANVAVARLRGVPNIFCGTLRHFPADAFSLVVSSYARHAGIARHLVTLKPNGIDPDTLPGGMRHRALGPGQPPRMAGLLVGGPSGLFEWRGDEWRSLAAFLADSARAHGTRWIVSTSRRTPVAVADLFVALAQQPDSPIAKLIDFRVAGPGTLPGLFGGVEAILATEDSSTMLSEAVCARLPVVGVAPARHDFKDDEREYRALLTARNWCRSLPLASLRPAAFVAALAEVRPLADNHLDLLAAAISERLPELFDGRPRI
ncbi:MAG: ELM1/GtrOC1 family putative glycosyltransferase [Hyphomicrobiaceae bacterium]